MSTFTLAMNRIMYDREKWGKQSEIERCLPMDSLQRRGRDYHISITFFKGFSLGKPLQLRHV